MLSFGNKEFRNLQEQVLKNAQDIEALKGRENLQIVIVEELPEEGNPNYIYLVPNEDEEESNIYNEYIWLADEERYELIGGVSIDLTNLVTLNTEQTISGIKTFSSGIKTASVSSAAALTLESESGIETKGNIAPQANNINDIGSSSKKYKDLYLGGNIQLDSDKQIAFSALTADKYFYLKSTNNTFHIGAYGLATSLVLDSYLTNFIPISNSQDFGNSSHYWRDLYLTGSLKDGVNTVTVANISTKTTSAYASGTFDANGESTIDISGGTPTGLFIFAYGNCECLVHLTATMVQNADLSPIRVACPMIYNSGAVNGWLEISKSSDTLTIKVKDESNHVDSGYAWTLTKTNLL